MLNSCLINPILPVSGLNSVVINTLGIALIFESLFMLIDVPVSLVYGGTDVYAIGRSFLITLASGGVMVLATHRNQMKEPGLRDSFLVVVLVWIFISLFGTLSYLLSHSIPRFVDAFFETVSGFTTTGSSILVILSIYSFAFIYFLTFLIGSIIMMGTGLDYKPAFSSVITTLGGIGPGLGKVGPANNFSGITDFGKYYLSFNMIMGRLEILSVLAIFTPSFYKT
jgi:Trk-type K+ transport system membrane component